MAQEWYLMKSPYNQVSGFESESLDEYGSESLNEMLASDIAQDIELYASNLILIKAMRAIVNNRIKDTTLNSLQRQMIVPIGTCKAGMYVKYKNRFWLITNCVDDNGVYEKAILAICNWCLTWINDCGDIVQRWANITSASQYNNGETSTKNYYLRTDQLMVIIPKDKESLVLNQGKRFIIDEKCTLYENDLTASKDTSKSVITYQLTRADTVLYNFSDSGNFQFIATQDEQQPNDGYYVIGNKGYWLCDEPKIGNKSPILSCSIECDAPEILDGISPTTFTAVFSDISGTKVSAIPIWNIECEFKDKLQITYTENKIIIGTNDSKLINKSFNLSLSAEGYNSDCIEVFIKAFI